MDEKLQHTIGVRRSLSRREMLRRAATIGGTFVATLLVSCGGSTATPNAEATATGAAPAATDATAMPAAAGATAAPATTDATAMPAAASTTTAPAAGGTSPVTLRVWGYGL